MGLKVKENLTAAALTLGVYFLINFPFNFTAPHFSLCSRLFPLKIQTFPYTTVGGGNVSLDVTDRVG